MKQENPRRNIDLALESNEIESNPNEPAELARIRLIARAMDELIEIPVLKWRIGLDGILGLIPFFGDFSGFLVSTYLLVIAARLEAPKIVLGRMFANILIDSLIGAVPFVGDLFDFAWKSNTKNVALLERHIAEPKKAKRASLGFFIFLVMMLVAVFVGLVWLGVWLIQTIRAAAA